MTEHIRQFFGWVKDWWELSIFVTATLIGLVIKAVSCYRLTHTTAHKVAAIEKVLKEDMLTASTCDKNRVNCQDLNELQFAHGQEAFNEIRGHLDKIDVKIDDNHNCLVNLIIEATNGKNGSKQ